MHLVTVYQATYFEALTLRVILESEGVLVFLPDVELKTADPTMTGYPCFDTTVRVPADVAEDVCTWIRDKWRPWRFAATAEERRSTDPRRLEIVGRSIRWASCHGLTYLLALWMWPGYGSRANRASRRPGHHRVTGLAVLFQGGFLMLFGFLWVLDLLMQATPRW